MNLEDIFNLEYLILNKMNWEVITYTVYDLSNLILDNLLVEDEIINNDIDILILKKTFKDYVSFCISGIIKLLSRF